MPVAFNPDSGDAMYLDPESGWLPTKLAVNPKTGDRVAFDGEAWVPVKASATPNPAKAAEDQWRQGNQMPPIGAPPERALGETPFGGALKLGQSVYEQLKDKSFLPDMGAFNGPSGERDDPYRATALSEANKLLPAAIPGGPPIMRGFGGGRVAGAIPESPISPSGLRVAEAWRGPRMGEDAIKLPGAPPAAPSVTEGPNPAIPPPPVMPVARPRSGARLLPPETPHSLPPEPPAVHQARASAGAAASGRGPLTDLSPQGERMLRQVFEQEGISPYMIEQRIGEMSPHEFLGELSPNLKLHTSGLQSHVGQARNEIQGAVQERAREAPVRMATAFDEAFGPAKNGFELIKQMKDARSKDSKAAWDAFLRAPIGPFHGMDKLMARLDAAGALKAANKAMNEWGHPVSNQFEVGSGIRVKPEITTGGAPIETQQVLTAASFQHAKEHLDLLIKKALRNEDDKGVMRYTALKNDLVKAIDNHPDPRVAGQWKTAREQWADPTQLMNALKLGERVLRGDVHQYQLPMLTESFGAPEMQALAQGMRSHMFDRAGRPGKQDLASMNLVLAPSNQAKIAQVIGEDKAANLIGAISHEHRMHTAPTDLIYGSMTAPREAAKKFWAPQEATLPGGVPFSVKGAGRMAVDAGLNVLSGKYNAREALKLEKVREEVSRIMTLQGPERDAALYYLSQKPELRVVGSP